MVTKIRPELSVKNKYWVNKHRYYELKHFCLQYSFWKEILETMDDAYISSSVVDSMPSGNNIVNLTSKYVMKKTYLTERINLIENTALDADPNLHEYILKAVTEGLSYTYLKSRLDIPCSKDTYYDRYRRFFWLLSEARE